MSGARRRFRFIKEIAEGGFGKVYLAEQLSQDGFSRIVALKLLHQKWSTHDEVVMRTRDEARLLGLIRHQHIVRVEDLTSVDGKLAIVMEYLEGVDLKLVMAYLKERGLQFPRQALFEIFIAVAGALDAAYNGEPLQGGEPLRVIHRDIKPSNVFVTVNGGIKVLDFGTARANFEAREAKTQALAFGSQGYMAPERMLGEEDTPAADVFSLGVTLHEMLSLESFGRIPPRPNKFVAKIDEKVDATPLEGDPEWCDQVRETLHLMMAYEPSERPSAKQLVDIFEILAQGAGDMGMRRFCRTMVAEAKSSLPAFDSGDPLTGAVIEEDPSSVWGLTPGAVPPGAAPPSDPPPAPAPDPVTTPAPAPSPSPATPRSSTPAPVSRSATPAPMAARALAEAPESVFEDEEEPPKKRGGVMKLLAAVVALVVIVGLLLVFGAVVAIGGAWYFSTTGTEAVAEVDPVPPEPVVAQGNSGGGDVEAQPEEPGLDLPDGGRILAEDRRGAEAPRSKKTTLTLDGDSAALVTIVGSFGVKAEWDGKGAFDLGALPAGRYRTFVTPVSTGEKIRNSAFEISEGQTCAYTFDVPAESWKGSCK